METVPPTEGRLENPNYELFGTFEAPKSSIDGLTREILEDIEFLSIIVDTEKKVIIIRTNNKDFDPLEFPVALGEKGVAEKDEGVQGDEKTPKGEFEIRGARLPEDDPMDEVFTRDGSASYGPSFVYLDARDENGDIRAVGFHGSNENELRETWGCIRLFNDDMLLIRDKLEIGLEVSII